MLTRFTATGFRNLSALDVELGRVNVFIGANNCGKTNLFEAALREAFPAPVACWGTRKPAGGCEPKFRLKFEAALGGRYRPATQGPGLVLSLDLAKLAEGEDVFVRPAWQALLRLVRSAG